MNDNLVTLLLIFGLFILFKFIPVIRTWMHYLFVALPRHKRDMKRIDEKFQLDMKAINCGLFWQLSDITDIFTESYESHNIHMTFEDYCKRIHSHLEEVEITYSSGTVTLRLYDLEQTLNTPFIWS